MSTGFARRNKIEQVLNGQLELVLVAPVGIDGPIFCVIRAVEAVLNVARYLPAAWALLWAIAAFLAQYPDRVRPAQGLNPRGANPPGSSSVRPGTRGLNPSPTFFSFPNSIWNKRIPVS